MCVQYYQDKNEFQARGNAHIHGCAWSDFDKLEGYFPGIKQTFEKLKQRQHLFPEDKYPLTDLIKKTVTCTLSAEKLMKNFDLDRDGLENCEISQGSQCPSSHKDLQEKH